MAILSSKLLSPQRVTTLLTALLVSLASGTNYVFSAYAPQLGHRLRINHTQLNTIALAGNMGVYATAPIWGRIVDRNGPRGLLVMGFFGLLIGYSGIRWAYDAGLPTSTDADGHTIFESLPKSHLYMLVLCGFLSGVGGNGGFAGAVNTTAKSFPDSARATATGLVISGFGLSAFFFSSIAHLLFPGNTSAFLLVLALGTSFPMLIGFFFLRPVPIDDVEPSGSLTHSRLSSSGRAGHHDVVREGAPAGVISRSHDSLTPLLTAFTDDSTDDLEHGPHHRRPSSRRESLELSPTRDTLPRRPRGARSRSAVTVESVFSQAAAEAGVVEDRKEGLRDISGWGLAKEGDFWLLFCIMVLLSGTGLMYINNVGSIAQSLFAQKYEYDEVIAAQWQAAQVSLLSIANCFGRIFIGLTADWIKSIGLRRATCISLTCTLFLISQLVCLAVDNVEHLWVVSALLGFAYGSMYGLLPTITIEWFGLAHLSENWGYLNLAPLIGGNVFSLAFGRNLDAHASLPNNDNTSLVSRAVRSFLSLPPRGGVPSEHLCLAGKKCYDASVKMSSAATALALALSVWAVVRDRRKAQEMEREETGIVIWEEQE